MAKAKTGSFRTRKGKMIARVTYTDVTDGIRKYIEKTVKTKSEGLTFNRETINKLDEAERTGNYSSVKPSKRTFVELAEKYKAVYCHAPKLVDGKKDEVDRGLKSWKKVAAFVDRWAEHFGQRTLESFTEQLIIEARRELLLDKPVERIINVKVAIENPAGRKKFNIVKKTITKDRSRASINRPLATLRAMLNYAVEIGWLAVSPFPKGLIIISKEVKRDKILNAQEEIALLRAVEKSTSKFLKIICWLALDCGMRKTEIVSLKWRDVNLLARQVTVNASKTETTRVLFLTERIVEQLSKMQGSPDERILPINDIKRSWGTVIKEANLTGLRFHDLRHCHASKAMALGMPIGEIRDQLGHSSLAVTNRYLNRDTTSAKAYTSVFDQHNQALQIEAEKTILISEASN